MKKTPLPPLTANLAAAILGIWKLKSREDVDATEQVHIDPLLGPEPLGILCFGPGHFAAQFMKRDRSPQPNAPPPGMTTARASIRARRRTPADTVDVATGRFRQRKLSLVSFF